MIGLMMLLVYISISSSFNPLMLLALRTLMQQTPGD